MACLPIALEGPVMLSISDYSSHPDSIPEAEDLGWIVSFVLFHCIAR